MFEVGQKVKASWTDHIMTIEEVSQDHVSLPDDKIVVSFEINGEKKLATISTYGLVNI